MAAPKKQNHSAFPNGQKYRLITRSDMDGLVCAVLLKELDLINDIMFAHPKDMQDGLIEVFSSDITTNLPYAAGVHMSFDHHASEISRAGGDERTNHVIDGKAPSAARVVYEYFGGETAFPDICQEMMAAVDKADAAQFNRDEILNPKGWELLSFVMDARTGLGRFADFTISNYQLMMKLIDICGTHSIEEIMELPDVKERVKLYKEHAEKHKEQLKRCTKVHGDLAVIDLRDEETIFAGNRFVVYALFPDANISAHVMWGKNRQNTVFAVGKSIINRTSKVNVGSLMLSYGGGGHEAAGTCQIDNEQSARVMGELIEKIAAAA